MTTCVRAPDAGDSYARDPGTILSVPTPSPTTAQPSQPQSSGASSDTRHLSRATIIAAVASAVILILGGVATSLWFTGDSATKTPTSPSVEIESVKWLGMDGRYEVAGTVKNFGNNHLIWTYNQPYDYASGDPGPLYPDPGPCPVDENGNFRCNLGYAGSLQNDAGRKFNIWAAVVSDEDAYDAASVKAQLDNRSAYANAVAVPHVDGAETMDSFEVTHPGSRP